MNETDRGAPNVTVDARMAFHSGIGRYIRGLTAELARLHPRLGLSLMIDPRLGGADWLDAPHVGYVPFDAGIYSLKEQLVGSWVCRARGRDRAVFHFPHYNAPWLLPRSSVVTIHDLTHLQFPQFFRAGRRRLARVVLLRVVRRADHLIAVSEATRRALEKLLPAAAGKITVIHHGVDPGFRPLSPAGVEAFRHRRNLGRYLLCVGNAKPHKNLNRLVEAFAKLRRSGAEVELVLVGDPAAPRGDGVRVEGRVEDAELVEWYNAADALVLPSLNEGFGLSALEAMACGTPVLGSEIDALREVAGDAAILVAPRDVDAWSAALQTILDDADRRAELRRRGLIRAERFTWSEAAQRTLAVYEQVIR